MTGVYPTRDEFVELLKSDDLRQLVRDRLFAGLPFVYRDSPETYDDLRHRLAVALNVLDSDVTIVGSGRLGFSLSPDNFGAAFRDESDLDVLVVSDRLFDEIWLDMVSLSRRAFGMLPLRDKERVLEHKTNEVYWGRLWPHKLVRVSKVARRWVGAFRALSRNPRLAYHEPRGRLYRTWNHAELYHVDGLSQLRFELRRIGGTTLPN